MEDLILHMEKMYLIEVDEVDDEISDLEAKHIANEGATKLPQQFLAEERR